MKRRNILKLIAQELGYSVEDILTKGKKTDVLYARYITIAILREEGYSTNEIASLFTEWSRNNISKHCVEVFNDLLSYNRKFKDLYLKAVKAVEDSDYEDENDQKSA